MVTRREFVKSSLLFGLGAASSGLTVYYLKNQPKSTARLAGTIWTVGEGGGGFTADTHHSTLSVFELSRASVSQKAVPLKFGHQVVTLDAERMLCIGYQAKSLPVIERKSLSVIDHIKVPDRDLGFSGHGHIFNETLYLPCLSTSDGYKKGGVQSYHLDSLKLKDFIETSYPYPHDVTSSNGNLYISYNDTGFDKGQYTFDGHKTAVLEFNINEKSDEVVLAKEFPSTDKLTAFSHLDADAFGNIFISTAQMIRSLYDRKTLRAHLEAQSIEALPVTSTEYRKNRFSLDSPILKLNTSSAHFDVIQLGLEKQRRPLSTVFNPYNGHTYVTCPHSNTLIEIPENPSHARAISALKLGITGVQGLSCLNNGQQMAISGVDRGVVIFDTQTLETLQVFDAPLNISTHLTYTSNS